VRTGDQGWWTEDVKAGCIRCTGEETEELEARHACKGKPRNEEHAARARGKNKDLENDL